MCIVDCVVYEHEYWMVMLAALICTVGASVIMHLYRRAAATSGSPRLGWIFLTAVCSGSSIWATNFIAILGYQTTAGVNFDPVLIFASILVAIVGTGLGFAIASSSRSAATALLGGGTVGLSIAAMHYTGMFAYRVQGIVDWDQGYIALSLILALALSIATFVAERRWHEGPKRHVPIATLVLAIVSLHFTGMAAIQITPTATDFQGLNAEAMQAMAMLVLVAALIIVGTGISSYLIDERTRAAGTAQLQRMAFEDSLTGLANRRAFQEHLAQAYRAGDEFALLLVDIDHFRCINDTYGHAIGDRLLVETARRLTELVGDTAFVARVGGDELALVARFEREEALAYVDGLLDLVKVPIEVGERQVPHGCSIGMCMSGDAATPDELIHHADLALYEAKRLGRGRGSLYAPGMAEGAARRLQIQAELETALEKNQFHLVYQPLIDLSTKRPIGYEALIRWEHPERGLIPPDQFIPVAEETGAIVDIGEWVLQEACREAATWDPDLSVSVNVSAVQFANTDVLAQVTRALSENGLLPHRLEIELTETAMVTDGGKVVHMLKALRELGTRIAMDDFGTGYSSLAHLRDLPLDRIKIDRSFVSRANTDANCMAVLRAITQLGSDIAIPTLAEGVETTEQEQMLESLGCDAAQGYLFGKPQRGEHLTGIRNAEDHCATASA